MPRAVSNRREFLQLADKYKPGKSKVGGWFLSEKLDGTRCLWDGGVSRGLPTESVPYASVLHPKTGKPKGKVKSIATGLWSRYGNPIMAPDWFLNTLPCMPLDGELWAGRGKFQLCRSICAGDEPDPRFDQIQYAVYGLPPITNVFNSGLIKNANFLCDIDGPAVQAWALNRIKTMGVELFSLPPTAMFFNEVEALGKYLDGLSDHVFMHKQIKLSQDNATADAEIETHMDRIIDEGGEGIVLRHPSSPWTPKRVNTLLKFKPFDDDEAVITGFTAGAETDKGSKHLGKIGALIVNYKGKRLKLGNGLKDFEREFARQSDADTAWNNPEKDMPVGTQAQHFKVGQKVTFLYRELSDDGIPKEARYLRKRDDE